MKKLLILAVAALMGTSTFAQKQVVDAQGDTVVARSARVIPTEAQHQLDMKNVKNVKVAPQQKAVRPEMQKQVGTKLTAAKNQKAMQKVAGNISTKKVTVNHNAQKEFKGNVTWKNKKAKLQKYAAAKPISGKVVPSGKFTQPKVAAPLAGQKFTKLTNFKPAKQFVSNVPNLKAQSRLNGLKQITELKDLKPYGFAETQANGKKKAPALKANYSAHGISVDEMDARGNVTGYHEESWVMQSSDATLADGTPVSVLVDIIAEPSSFKSIYPNGVPAVYTAKGNTLTVEPMIIAETRLDNGGTGYIYIASAANESGVFSLNVDDNGNVSFADSDEVVCYIVCTSQNFNWEAAEGFYALFMQIEYSVGGGGGSGSNVPDPTYPNFTATYKYKGSALDYADGQQTAVTWNSYIGKYTYSQGTVDVILDIIPDYVTQAGNGVLVEYVQQGNQITVPAQLLGESEEGYVFLFNNLTTDGSYPMTIDANGNLTTPTDVNRLVYGVFKTDVYDMNNFLGYYELEDDITYKLATAGGGGGAAPQPAWPGVDVQYTYVGTGTDYDSGKNVEWNAWLGKLTENGQTFDVFLDPVPNIFSPNLPNVLLEAQRKGNKIVIPAQYFATTTGKTGATEYIFAFSTSNEDGSIEMTIGEDGKLQTVAMEEILYAAFQYPEFDTTLETMTGRGDITDYVKYTLYGSTPGSIDIPGFTAQYKYDASGQDYDGQKATPVTWKAALGTYSEYGDEYNVMVNPAPMNFGSDYCMVDYVQKGNKITIEPQVVAQGQAEDGSPLYLILLSAMSDDASINMTIDDKGQLTTVDEEALLFGVFSVPYVQIDSNDELEGYMGFQSAYLNVAYALEGTTPTPGPGPGPGPDPQPQPIPDNFTLVQDYTGYARDYFEEKDVTWTMKHVQDAEGNDWILDLVPNQTEGQLDFIAVPCTIADGVITIAPQSVFEISQGRTTYNVFLVSENSEDGSIIMPIGEDGNIYCCQGLALMASAKSTFNWDTAAGAFSYFQNVRFALPGKEPCVNDPSLIVRESIKAYGYDVFESASTSWTTKIGNYKGREVIVDVIPSIYGDGSNIMLDYEQHGDSIVIRPQYVGATSGEIDGQTLQFYVYFFDLYSDDGSCTIVRQKNGEYTAYGTSVGYGVFLEDAFDPTLDTFAGLFEYIQNLHYSVEVEYTPDDLFLHLSFSPSFYSFNSNLAMAPVDTQMNFINTTTDPLEAYQWSTSEMEEDYSIGDKIISDDVDFTMNLEKNKSYSFPLLKGFNQGTVTEFMWGNRDGSTPTTKLIAGTSGNDYVYTDGSKPIVTKADPSNGITIYGFLGTPDQNENYEVTDIYAYQGKPAAPLYIEGVNLLAYEFEATKNMQLTCQIVKANRTVNGELIIGDLIAEAQLLPKDIVCLRDDVYQLNFNNLYVYEPNGLTRGVDHLFIDDEFAVVFRDWNNGTFSASPFGEAEAIVNGMPSTFYSRLDEEGNISMTALGANNCIIAGFNGAAYGYLDANTDGNVVLPVEGGSATIHVEPMYCSVSTKTGAVSTRLFNDYDTVIPSWLTVNCINENYTGDEYSFDIQLTADALPSSAEGRATKLVFWQEGAELVLNVSQGSGNSNVGDKDGINETMLQTASTKFFNLMGQKSNGSQRGILVRSGRKFIK